MWYTVNEAIGKILLVGVLGGALVYGGYKFFTAPPLLRQSGDETPNHYQQAATKQLQRQLRDLQEEQSRALNESMEIGRSFGS